jgi:hypothetical protein
VEGVIAAGADVIHFDVMDNHYDLNLMIGPVVCEAIRPRLRPSLPPFAAVSTGMSLGAGCGSKSMAE